MIKDNTDAADKNAADVMVAAYKTNQKELFRLACRFVRRLDVPILEIPMLEKEAWEKMKEKEPKLALAMMTEAFCPPTQKQTCKRDRHMQDYLAQKGNLVLRVSGLWLTAPSLSGSPSIP